MNTEIWTFQESKEEDARALLVMRVLANCRYIHVGHNKILPREIKKMCSLLFLPLRSMGLFFFFFLSNDNNIYNKNYRIYLLSKGAILFTNRNWRRFQVLWIICILTGVLPSFHLASNHLPTPTSPSLGWAVQLTSHVHPSR